MLKSMTGYGKATCNFGNKNITIEIRSVNSKQLDLNTRIPNLYKEKDLEIRNEISRQAERGKVDLFIIVEQAEPDRPIQINQTLLKNYFNQIKETATSLDINISEQALLSALRLPETLKSEMAVLTNEEWTCILNCLKAALSDFIKFRIQEGSALEKDIVTRINLIENKLSEIQPFEAPRIERIRERLAKNLNEFIPAGSIDANRFEQEIIYFLEKLDITEEKVRLKNHCSFFIETMKNEESPGRKLAFISQEIGREINTIGSKANDSEIQKLVVAMKDELEKIKEQMLNVL
jgi:uncharacterized protein (TIGR00255 family)